MKVLASQAGRQYDEPWDAMKIWGCMCDLGYRGPDCAQKVSSNRILCHLLFLDLHLSQECPSRADPLGGFGNESGRDCSGRGNCDYTTGLCKCYTGYHGAACDKYSVFE